MKRGDWVAVVCAGSSEIFWLARVRSFPSQCCSKDFFVDWFVRVAGDGRPHYVRTRNRSVVHTEALVAAGFQMEDQVHVLGQHMHTSGTGKRRMTVKFSYVMEIDLYDSIQYTIMSPNTQIAIV